MYRKIGILGGLSPESTVTYYLHIVRKYQNLFGNHNYPEIIIYSVSFQKFIDWMNENRWDKIAEELIKGIRKLAMAGADFALIATNTMHIVFHEVERASPIPLISIVDATAEAIKKENINIVGLLGTLFTMEKNFYKDGLAKYGIKTLIPEKSDREYINNVIFKELCRGLIQEETRNNFKRIIKKLTEMGAEGVVLGCTELSLLIDEKDVSTKIFDTATLHAEKALNLAIKPEFGKLHS